MWAVWVCLSPRQSRASRVPHGLVHAIYVTFLNYCEWHSAAANRREQRQWNEPLIDLHIENICPEPEGGLGDPEELWEVVCIPSSRVQVYANLIESWFVKVRWTILTFRQDLQRCPVITIKLPSITGHRGEIKIHFHKEHVWFPSPEQRSCHWFRVRK